MSALDNWRRDNRMPRYNRGARLGGVGAFAKLIDRRDNVGVCRPDEYTAVRVIGRIRADDVCVGTTTRGEAFDIIILATHGTVPDQSDLIVRDRRGQSCWCGRRIRARTGPDQDIREVSIHFQSRAVALFVNAVLQIKISRAVILLRPDQVLIDPDVDGACDEVVVHVQLKPFIRKIGGEGGSAVIMHGAAIVCEPKCHECGRAVRGRLRVSGVNLEHAVAVLVRRRHDHRLILDFAVGVVGIVALLRARKGGIADLESAVIAVNEAVINIIREPIALVLRDICRPLNFEVQSFGLPARAANLRGRGEHQRGEREDSENRGLGAAKHIGIAPDYRLVVGH